MKKKLTTKDFKELISCHPKCPQFPKKQAWYKPNLQDLANKYKAMAEFTEMILKQKRAISITVQNQTIYFDYINGNAKAVLGEVGMDVLLPYLEEICQERGFALKNYDLLTAIAA